MKYPSFNLLGVCFVLAGVVRVSEIFSINFFKIKSSDFLVVLGAIFLAYICWTISRLLPSIIQFLNLQERVCKQAINNWNQLEEEDDNSV